MLLRQRAVLGSTSVAKLEINAPRSVSEAFLGAKEDPLKIFIGSFTDDSAAASLSAMALAELLEASELASTVTEPESVVPILELRSFVVT